MSDLCMSVSGDLRQPKAVPANPSTAAAYNQTPEGMLKGAQHWVPSRTPLGPHPDRLRAGVEHGVATDYTVESRKGASFAAVATNFYWVLGYTLPVVALALFLFRRNMLE